MIRVKVYVGHDIDSQTLIGEGDGHVVTVVVENGDGQVITSFSSTDNEGSEFANLDFLNPDEG